MIGHEIQHGHFQALAAADVHDHAQFRPGQFIPCVALQAGHFEQIAIAVGAPGSGLIDFDFLDGVFQKRANDFLIVFSGNDLQGIGADGFDPKVHAVIEIFFLMIQHVIVVIVVFLPGIFGVGLIRAEGDELAIPHLPEDGLARLVKIKDHIDAVSHQDGRGTTSIEDHIFLNGVEVFLKLIDLFRIHNFFNAPIGIDIAKCRIFGEERLFIGAQCLCGLIERMGRNKGPLTAFVRKALMERTDDGVPIDAIPAVKGGDDAAVQLRLLLQNAVYDNLERAPGSTYHSVLAGLGNLDHVFSVSSIFIQWHSANLPFYSNKTVFYSVESL